MHNTEPARLTGERCPSCLGYQVFAPGYLVQNPDGSRYFTVKREMAHRPGCSTLTECAYVDDGVVPGFQPATASQRCNACTGECAWEPGMADDPHCPKCLDPIDYCLGHGELG